MAEQNPRPSSQIHVVGPLEVAANAALEAKQAALEAVGMMGEMLRETSHLGRRVDGLTEKVDTLLLHSSRMSEAHVGGHGQLPGSGRGSNRPEPMRARCSSVSDIDSEEVTMNGTKYLRVTPDQIEQIIDARIQTREEQARVESAAAPILWFKGNAAKFVVAAGVAMAGMAGAAAWSVLKSLWAKLSH